MSSASEQLLYAINSLTETLGDLTGLLTEVIAEEYELDDDDLWVEFQPVTQANMAALGDLVTPFGESLDTNGITQLMNTLILPGREMFELVHNHSDHSSGFRHARRHLSRRRLGFFLCLC